MKDIIEKLLEEVDADIKELMLSVDENIGGQDYFKWQLLSDPINAIINWQALRDRKHDLETLR
ncbi:MAG: hypothetical protein IPP74_14645 [Alphaproteobacteria bacterium]|nr:hypothetical protein [Alphaproteobacteria bacterium]